MRYQGLTGKVVLPGDPLYGPARREYNAAVDAFPAAIVYCAYAGDVAGAIRWSRRHDLRLRVRSGGHSYEGYSTGNDTLVIDTSCMNGIDVDTAGDTVTVQAGVRLLALYESLAKHGYAFPGGTCPTVAIAGLVLGGGIGLSTRYLGLTADSLKAAAMVDAGGRLLVADHSSQPELFWALRGAGGGNFGVATAFKFSLKIKVGDITLIRLRWDDDKAARDRFLAVWQEWLPGLDRRLSAFGGIYRQGAWLNAFFYGRPAEAQALLAPFLAIPGITLERIDGMPFLDAVKDIAAGYPPREAFQTTGRFVHRPFSPAELAMLVGVIEAAPSARDSSLRVYSLGGAVSDVGTDATAFYYRQADYILAATSSWEDPGQAPAHRRWVKSAFDHMYPITCGSYVNFPYSRTPAYEEAYYGGHVERLRSVKAKYDPDDVFSFPQSIRLP